MDLPLRYEITDFAADAHELGVRLRIPAASIGDAVMELSLPAWIPGSYMIRDFARNVVAITASDDSGPLSVIKRDKQTWQLVCGGGDVVVDYCVYAFEVSVRAAYLDATRAYFNGTSIFLHVRGLEDAAWTLDIPRPPFAEGLAWRLATDMIAAAIDSDGFGVYQGVGYESLIDSPVEISPHEGSHFYVAGVPHRFVVSDGGRFDIERLVSDVGRICAEHAAMFGVLPLDRYLFMTLATTDGYGGLEHAYSTSLICKRSDLPRHGPKRSPDAGYRRLLGLCSHEYFHLWNVKRIRPAVLAEADLSAEAHTELLWAFEGITSYYDDLALVRSAVIAPDDYLSLLAEQVSRLLRNPGRLRQSVAASSFDAWTKFYKQDENAANAIVSYYTKGACVAFGLDVTIRRATSDRRSLDDLMSLLWTRYGEPGRGMPERAIEALVDELTGSSQAEFFARYVYGTDELPWQDWFSALGIGYRTRASRNDEDLGGCRRDEQDDASPPGPTFGARFRNGPEGLTLTQVTAGGPAQRAGLSPSDLVIAIDGQRASGDRLDDILSRAHPPDVAVHYFRRDQLRETRLPLEPRPADACELWMVPEDRIEPEILARRRDWLASRQADVDQ
jgi:predicted metalloprotease with PDZ domain